MSTIFGDDPVAVEVARVLGALRDGSWDGAESSLVDLKEESGRRDGAGNLLPGLPESEQAAMQIAGEAACMANTPGGGALIVGVDKHGALLGTALSLEWLRHRVYELTNRTLTISVQEADVNGVRVLVVTAPQAIEPIRWRGRVHWRVDDNCVDVDPATWHSARMIRTNFDWSAQPSHVDATAARESAVEVARKWLRDSNEPGAIELASQTTPELLRRLNVVTGEGLLTNAGVLAFVGRGESALDYIRRDVAGGDSRQRVRVGGRGIIEELQEVFVHVAAHNAVIHRAVGVVAGQHTELPEQAVREAIVNGLAHRDWSQSQATVVEHIGKTLRVTSPGGFFGGVTAANIITHPSQSRNRALAELLAALRVAEREGVGVDRMVKEMVRLGHRAPAIEQIDGPYVRVSLVGDAADEAWMGWLADVVPVELVEDLNVLLVLRQLVDQGWVDVASSAPILQLNRAETSGALNRAAAASMGSKSVLVPVTGVPDGDAPAWALSSPARSALQHRDRRSGVARNWPTREAIARSYALSRGRISSTELGALVGASPSNVGSVLKRLEDECFLRPSRENRRGAGFFYRPA